ncbi:hypothetical protein [Streptomyces sp. HUAS ZL42]|uniref:hypothetical protein n=1 Tax=Streptomyces sp. HUAS ZL42 TaxID=3231715 RepID=UPI00345E81B3
MRGHAVAKAEPFDRVQGGYPARGRDMGPVVAHDRVRRTKIDDEGLERWGAVRPREGADVTAVPL